MSLPDEVRTRLQQERNAWLTTLRPDGSPHVTPVWFVFTDPVWWICSPSRSRKVRNLGNDPRVAIALEDGEAPVVAEGEVTVRTADFPRPVAAQFRAKYGWDIVGSTEDGPLALLEVDVRRWLLTGQPQ